jgi:hypothetical protein
MSHGWAEIADRDFTPIPSGLRTARRFVGQQPRSQPVSFAWYRMTRPGRWLGSVIAVAWLPIAAGAAMGIAPATAAVLPHPPAQTCSGTSVADIRADILHEADGGVAGNVWALDSGSERAQVWQQDVGNFCVVQTFVGHFTTFAGTSPGGGGTVASGVTGWVVSRQRYVVSAAFTPIIPTTGFLGTFDFRCDQSGHCPGNVAFGPLLFSNITAVTGATSTELAASRHGVWVQTDSTSRGDITR